MQEISLSTCTTLHLIPKWWSCCISQSFRIIQRTRSSAVETQMQRSFAVKGAMYFILVATGTTSQEQSIPYRINYYHSGVRINIEFAFGVLVNRWDILQQASLHLSIDQTELIISDFLLRTVSFSENSELCAQLKLEEETMEDRGTWSIPWLTGRDRTEGEAPTLSNSILSQLPGPKSHKRRGIVKARFRLKQGCAPA